MAQVSEPTNTGEGMTFIQWLLSFDWLYGISYQRFKEAIAWADELMSAPRDKAAAMIAEHNKKCKEYHAKA